MAIKLNKVPHIKQTSEFKIALVDLDLIAFAVSSASDGHSYMVINPKTHELLVQERYKKDINKFFTDNPAVDKAWLTDDYAPEDLKTVLYSAKQMLTSILGDIGAKDYKLYLTGKDNFRYVLNPEYKAHRKLTRKPYHLQNVRDYFVKEWGAVVVDGMETDDQLGISQCANYICIKGDLDKGWVKKCTIKEVKDTVICTTDKDLKCIPGWNYEWPHHGKDAKLSFVTIEQARLNFYRQVLTGDKTDGIIGLHGIGPAKAEAYINASESTSNTDLYQSVLWAYIEMEGGLCDTLSVAIEKAEQRVLFVAQQIWILQEEGVMWQVPTI